jgi:PPM family protein phosphatase
MLCSDGLWGSVADSVIADLLSRRAISDAIPDLVEQALRTAGERSDNVTALAVEWEAAEDVDTTSGISTQSLAEGAFASTIQASMAASESGSADDMDDAEIERSIREINEAIERSGKNKR